jgi:hypothetical protein
MLGKAACIGLGIWRLELEPCPFQIQTSLGGASDRSNFMTRERLLVQMKSDHATDSSRLGVTIIVTTAESYDVLAGGAMLYLWVSRSIIGRRQQLIDLVGSLGMDG